MGAEQEVVGAEGVGVGEGFEAVPFLVVVVGTEAVVEGAEGVTHIDVHTLPKKDMVNEIADSIDISSRDWRWDFFFRRSLVKTG